MEFFLRRFFKYLAPLLSIFDKRLIRKYAKSDIKHPPVFIIGAPRTGSTVLYQLLTNRLNVSYINNFINLGYRSLFLNFLLSERLFKGRPHNSLKSEFGNTRKDGLNAPNEGGAFWYRWIPKGRDFLSKEDAKSIDAKCLQETVVAVSNRFNRPFLFKNMNAGMRLSLLSEAFPEARYIFIRREPAYTVQSILNVRKKRYNNYATWWSIKPPDFEQLQHLDPVKQVTLQVLQIEHQIEKDLHEYIDEKNYITLNYEELNKLPMVFEKVKDLIGNVDIRKNSVEPEDIDIRNNIAVDEDMFREIEKEIQKHQSNDQTVQA